MKISRPPNERGGLRGTVASTIDLPPTAEELGPLSTGPRSRLRRAGTLAVSAVLFLALVPLLLVAVIAGPLAGRGEAATECAGMPTTSLSGAPSNLVPIYAAAAAHYRLGSAGPAILAAINQVETNFGQNTSDSSAGAIGWMQFMPATWARYGVDADGDGRRDPNDPWDAIFSAAHYLSASGAPANWHKAIFAYNHAEWYVDMVFGRARNFDAGLETSVASFGSCSASVASPASPASLDRMITEASRLDALHLPYVWGGSHLSGPTPPNGPFDCSSAVSHLLQVAGYRNPTMTTTGLATWGEGGPGRLVTIHVKPSEPGAHTFLEFPTMPPERRYWGTSTTNVNGGPGWIPATVMSPGYLAEFQLRHPPGL